jgi:hypothetical protein
VNRFFISTFGFFINFFSRPVGMVVGMGILTAGGAVWTIGKLVNPIVPIINQQVLATWTLTGNSLLESNNPERIDSVGWLFQHQYPDEKRGGNRATLQGNFRVYVSHINGQKTSGYFQIIATNPNKTPLTITFKGSVLTSSETGDSRGVLGKSNYYKVSENALSGSLPTRTKSIAPGKTVLLSLKRLNPKTSVDGLLQVHSTQGVFVTVLATKTPYVEEGVRLLANRQPATGNIKSPTSSTFGTGAGIYPTWGVSATPTLTLPPTIAHLGLSFNYADYELSPANPNVQTALCQRNTENKTLCLRDSSTRSNGNYGREYNIRLKVVNPATTPQTVRVWFASNAIRAKRTLLNNGAVRFNKVIRQVVTTPTRPRQELTSIPLLVAPQSTLTIPLEFIIPGLSSAGQALIIETQP